MRYKQSFVTNSSTTAYIMVGKPLTVEEFKKRIDQKEFDKLVAVLLEVDYGQNPFRRDEEDLEEIAKSSDPERNHMFYEESGIRGNVDWATESFSLAPLKDKNIEDYEVIVYGTGGGC